MKGRTITWALIWVGVWILVAIWMHQIIFFDAAGHIVPDAVTMSFGGGTSGLAGSAGIAAGLTAIGYAIFRSLRG